MLRYLQYQENQANKAGHFRLVSIALLAFMLSGCGGGGSADQPANDGSNGAGTTDGDGTNGDGGSTDNEAACTADSQKQWAYDGMQDFYLFYDQVPVVNPLVYESADDVVKNVRFEERDPYSHVSKTGQSSLLFDEGREFGLGYDWAWDSNNKPRIKHVVKDSPFGRAGVERGDIIVSVDGLLWTDEKLGENFWDRVAGVPDKPSTARWEIEKRDTGERVFSNITGTEYAINTVLLRGVYTHNTTQQSIGYLAFRGFLDTSRDELNAAFKYFQEENIDDLVLDLRYNGGGRTSIAQHLASLIAGNDEAKKPIYNYRFNDRQSELNFSLDFENTAADLNLTRIVVLTSQRTASSSEIVISGLQPYMEVVTIGGKTNGKPYSSWAYDQCGERLNVIEAEGFNASGNSVFGGIEPSCYASDDLTRDFGLNNSQFEGMLGAGVDYLANGTCASAPIVVSGRSSATQPFKPFHGRQGISLLGGALNDPRTIPKQ